MNLSSHEAVVLAGRDVAMVIYIDLASSVQLLNNVLSMLVLCSHPVELGELRLHLLKPGQPVLNVLLLQHGLLLVGLHLGLCSPPLRADLQHVHGRTFVDCQKKKQMSEKVMNEILTGNGGAGGEGGGHVWVQFNE